MLGVLAPEGIASLTSMEAGFSRPDHTGAYHFECLAALHAHLRPASYLEITGGQDGTLDAASCASIAIGPRHPAAPVTVGDKPSLFLFAGDSNAFFDRHDPRLLVGRSLDLVLLDGLPLFETMLLDFCNVERACHTGSVIVVNNCLPLDAAMAGRDPGDLARRARSTQPDWWTGDVWKLILILTEHRPELRIYAFDAQPAGLIAITGLDPRSQTLSDRFDAIVAAYRELAEDPDADGDALWHSQAALPLHSTSRLTALLEAFPADAAAAPSGSDPATRPYRMIDPAHLPVIDLATVMTGAADGRHPEPPDGLRSCFRAAPAFIDDPGQRGIIQPFGNDAIQLRAPSVLSFTDIQLVGYRSILTASGLLVHDETEADARDFGRLAAKLSQRDDAFLNELTGLSRIERDNRFQLDPSGRRIVTIDETVIVLCSTEPGNYGSWIYRIIPKLYSLRRLGLDGIRILVHVPDPHHRTWLEALGVSWDLVIPHDTSVIYRIRHAIVPTLRNVLPFLESGGLAIFEDMRKRYGSAQADRRLYISRQGWSSSGKSTRVMLNEADLVERLTMEGFDIIQPETMTLAEQIHVFSSARLIVAPAGSALYNVVFCRPGTRIVDIESEPDWIPLHSCLFSSLGHHYGIVIGSTDRTDHSSVHKRWSVDIDSLMKSIARFEP